MYILMGIVGVLIAFFGSGIWSLGGLALAFVAWYFGTLKRIEEDPEFYANASFDDDEDEDEKSALDGLYEPFTTEATFNMGYGVMNELLDDN